MKSYSYLVASIFYGIFALGGINTTHALNPDTNHQVTIKNYLLIPIQVEFYDEANNIYQTNIDGTFASKSPAIADITLNMASNFVSKVVVKTIPIEGKSKRLATYQKDERPLGIIAIQGSGAKIKITNTSY